MKALCGVVKDMLVPASLLVLLVGVLKLIGYLAVIASDTGVALLLLLLWIPMAVLLLWRARRRRAVILGGCLIPSSPWHQHLRGGFVMAAVQSAAALPLAIVLLAVISQPQGTLFWALLLISGPLWWWLLSLWRSRLSSQLNSNFLQYVAALMSLRTAGVVLVLLWVLSSLWTPVPDVSALTLFQAARLGMTDAQADSQALLFVAGIWHGLSYVHLWLVQTLTAGAPSSLLALLAWLLLLLQGASCNQQIPAKLYEYLYCQRPLLALCHKDGEVAALCQQHNLGIWADIDDATAIAAALLQLLAQLKNNSARVLSAQELVLYSRQHQARRLLKLMQQP